MDAIPSSSAPFSVDYAAAQKYVDTLRPSGGNRPVFTEMTLPDWYDEERFKRAQLNYRRNIYATISGTMVGLMSILSIPTIIAVMSFTKQSDTSQLSYRRYLATVQHTMLWVTGDLKPGSPAWKSLEMIRKRHVLISRNSEQAKSGIISQADMALVQYSVVGFNLNNPELFGFVATPQQFDEITYLWRVLGHMLGIEERFNLFCDSRAENIARLSLVQQQIFRPCMTAANSPDYYRLADTLASGLSAINPLLSTDSFVYFVRMVNGCPGHVGYWQGEDAERLQTMSWWDRWLLWQQMAIHRWMVRHTATRIVLGVWSVGLVMMVTYAPVLAIWRFGWRRNLVRVMKHVR